ncbi:hypothetical protein VTO73DRAFT_9794 [Trametes versicolor]
MRHEVRRESVSGEGLRARTAPSVEHRQAVRRAAPPRSLRAREIHPRALVEPLETRWTTMRSSRMDVTGSRYACSAYIYRALAKFRGADIQELACQVSVDNVAKPCSSRPP